MRVLSSSAHRLPESLSGPLSSLRDAARKVGKAALDAQLPLNLEDYVGGFRHELMEPVAAWVRGAKFAEVMKMSPDMFEGSLVRAVRRLEELMRQVRAGEVEGGRGGGKESSGVGKQRRRRFDRGWR